MILQYFFPIFFIFLFLCSWFDRGGECVFILMFIVFCCGVVIVWGNREWMFRNDVHACFIVNSNDEMYEKIRCL
jgi:hypothetical protein